LSKAQQPDSPDGKIMAGIDRPLSDLMRLIDQVSISIGVNREDVKRFSKLGLDTKQQILQLVSCLFSSSLFREDGCIDIIPELWVKFISLLTRMVNIIPAPSHDGEGIYFPSCDDKFASSIFCAYIFSTRNMFLGLG
jgi:hypothetical protein